MADETVAQNPLTAGIESGLLPTPGSVVIFGGSGDLARRKLIPALYNTALDGLLPACVIVGFSLDEMSGEQYRKWSRGYAEKFSRRPHCSSTPTIAFGTGE